MIFHILFEDVVADYKGVHISKQPIFLEVLSYLFQRLLWYDDLDFFLQKTLSCNNWRKIIKILIPICRFNIFCSLSYKLFFQKHRIGGEKWTIWFFPWYFFYSFVVGVLGRFRMKMKNVINFFIKSPYESIAKVLVLILTSLQGRGKHYVKNSREYFSVRLLFL